MSIVVPTFNEKENVFQVAERVAGALKGIHYELVFVDDSRDETPQMLARLARTDSRVRFLHRTDERGLGTAVVKGFEIARGDVIAVMDADLQHPPEVLLPMLEGIHYGADIVIPSRFIPGGDDGGLNILRKLVSGVARYLGKVLLHVLRPISDPTGGLFMFKKNVIDGVKLQPVGWKILIEVLARGHYQKVLEIPYRFRARDQGESKMSFQEQWNYICHLAKLVKDSPADRRFYFFALVGLSGVAVNMLVYLVLTGLTMDVRMAGTMSALTAMISNFFLNDRFTWVEVNTGSKTGRALRFFITSTIGIWICVSVLSYSHYHLKVNYIAANLLGIAVSTIWNYLINNIWTWRSDSEKLSVSVKRWTEEDLARNVLLGQVASGQVPK